MAQEYNAYFKNCATCEFWAGSRTIQAPYCQRLYVASSAEKGQCLNRESGYMNSGARQAQMSCPKYKKWSVLK